MRLNFASKLALTSTLLVFTAGTMSAVAETIGNPLIPTTLTDNCTNCGFILGQAFSAPGTISTYSFYNNGTGGDITPLLFQAVSGGYQLVGIGSQVMLSAGNAGSYTESFGLTSGVGTVDSATYFGFENVTGSLVAYENTTPQLVNGGIAAYSPIVPLGSTVMVSGQTQDAFNEDLTRLYSVEATSVTPEPGTLSLMGTGLLAVGGLVRRRLKK